jgi:hypothetical protein
MSDADRASILHRALKEACRAQRKTDHQLAVLLAELEAGRHYETLGYATLVDYARAELDLDRRRTYDLSSVGRRLGRLPALDAALAEGRLAVTKARELVRVVTPETEGRWLEKCEGMTNRQIEQLVRSVPAGEPPPEKLPPEALGPAVQTLVLKAESTDADLIRALIRAVQAQARAGGEELDDAAALAVAARFWLDRHVEDDEPRDGPAYTIVIHADPDGELRCGNDEVSQTTAEMALCDAELVDMSHGPTRGRARRTVPPARRRAVLARDDRRCVVPGCSCRAWLDVHHLRAWALGGTHDEGNLALVCRFHHGLLHDGRLALERLPDGRWRVAFSPDRVVTGPPPRVPTWEREPTTPPPYGVPPAWSAAPGFG